MDMATNSRPSSYPFRHSDQVPYRTSAGGHQHDEMVTVNLRQHDNTTRDAIFHIRSGFDGRKHLSINQEQGSQTCALMCIVRVLLSLDAVETPGGAISESTRRGLRPLALETRRLLSSHMTTEDQLRAAVKRIENVIYNKANGYSGKFEKGQAWDLNELFEDMVLGLPQFMYTFIQMKLCCDAIHRAQDSSGPITKAVIILQKKWLPDRDGNRSIQNAFKAWVRRRDETPQDGLEECTQRENCRIKLEQPLPPLEYPELFEKDVALPYFCYLSCGEFKNKHGVYMIGWALKEVKDWSLLRDEESFTFWQHGNDHVRGAATPVDKRSTTYTLTGVFYWIEHHYKAIIKVDGKLYMYDPLMVDSRYRNQEVSDWYGTPQLLNQRAGQASADAYWVSSARLRGLLYTRKEVGSLKRQSLVSRGKLLQDLPAHVRASGG